MRFIVLVASAYTVPPKQFNTPIVKYSIKSSSICVRHHWNTWRLAAFFLIKKVWNICFLSCHHWNQEFSSKWQQARIAFMLTKIISIITHSAQAQLTQIFLLPQICKLYISPPPDIWSYKPIVTPCCKWNNLNVNLLADKKKPL